jgi:hypothetical protein
MKENRVLLEINAEVKEKINRSLQYYENHEQVMIEHFQSDPFKEPRTQARIITRIGEELRDLKILREYFITAEHFGVLNIIVDERIVKLLREKEMIDFYE